MPHLADGTDSSGDRSSVFKVFKTAIEFTAEWIGVHFNAKGTFALHEVLRLIVDQYQDRLSGITLVVDVDNTTMFHAFRKGRAGDERMRDLIKPLIYMVTSRL